MLSKITFRQILLGFFSLSIIIRFIFVLTTQQIPVMWDARIYSSAALGLLHYADNPGRFGHPGLDKPADSAFNRSQFEYTMKEYIEGEQIAWLYYAIPTVAQAQDYIFLSGPIYPIYLAVIFLINMGNDFPLVRVLNVILDGLCLVLLMLIVHRLFDRRTAITAGILYMFYLPFILLTGIVSPDSTTILLILLTTYLILKWYDGQKVKYLYLSGLSLGLLALNKPTAVLLIIPFGVGLLYDQRKEIRKMLPPVMRLVIPFLAVVVPWVIITSLYYGKLSIRDPEYSAANFRSSSSIKYEGYDLDYNDPDFWIAPVSYSIAGDPLGYGKLLLKKFVRLWSTPYDDFKRGFIFSYKVSVIYHLLIVLTGLYGVFYFAGNSRRGLIFLFLIPLYYTLIHIIFHSLARYNLNAMSFVMIASAAVMVKMYDFVSASWRTKGVGRTAISVGLFILGGLFVLFFPLSYAVEIIGTGFGRFAVIFAKIIILIALLSYIIRVVGKIVGPQMALKIMLAPSAILLAVLVFLGGSAEGWAEWKCRLADPAQTAGVRIYVGKDFRLQPGELVRIGIDMTANKGQKNPFILSLNGQKLAYQINQPPISEFYYKKGTYDVYEKHLNLGKEEMRVWRYMPISSEMFNEMLDRNGYIDINVGTGSLFPEKGDFLDLYGNYNITDRGKALIPCMTHYSNSIERFVEKGDPRIWVGYNLSSDSAISYYIDKNGRQSSPVDLSTARGLQNGRYRIFIEAKRFTDVSYYF